MIKDANRLEGLLELLQDELQGGAEDMAGVQYLAAAIERVAHRIANQALSARAHNALKLQPPETDDDLISTREVRDICGFEQTDALSYSTIRQCFPDFPAPVRGRDPEDRSRTRHLFRRGDITAWAAANGRSSRNG